MYMLRQIWGGNLLNIQLRQTKKLFEKQISYEIRGDGVYITQAGKKFRKIIKK